MSVYFDHNATTPLCDGAFEAMRPWLTGRCGNGSALHSPGRRARHAIDEARRAVADSVGALPDEVVFTSGGTESDNLAVKGLAAARRDRPRVLVSAIEHPAVADAAQALAFSGYHVETIGVDDQGRVDVDALAAQLLGDDVALVSIMAANNETGVLQDIPGLADLCHRHDARFHTDAVQAAGHHGFDFAASGADCASISAHKIGGPQGMGALLVGRGLAIEAQLHGGGHEHGLRSGSANVAGIVGFGAAAAYATESRVDAGTHLSALRRQLDAGLDGINGVSRFSDLAPRLANTTQFALAGFDGEALLMMLDETGFAVSSGSACAAGSGRVSPVLEAMAVDPITAKGALRVSLGVTNTADEIEAFLVALADRAGAAQTPAPGRFNASVLTG